MAKALAIRHETANKQFEGSATVNHRPNDDESQHANYVACFTKALPHDAEGRVDGAAYRKLIDAVNSGLEAEFASIPMGGARKLANPQAAFAYSLCGADSHALMMPAAPTLTSAWEAGEMVEVYWQAALRDVPFESYVTDSRVAAAVADMNGLTDFRGPKQNGVVTPSTLFRGETAGDLAGNYLSQFLLLDIPYGATTIQQRYRVPQQGDDYMLTRTTWLDVQNGNVPEGPNQLDPVTRYLATGRDLGEYVHRDFSYQAFLNAANILLGMGMPTQAGNPYHGRSNQGAFVTFGGPDILSLVAEVALCGLKAAWFHKWCVHRRLRPEAFGGLVNAELNGRAQYSLHSDVLNSAVLDQFGSQVERGLLPMAYPEGSPTHPAYPAGHAVIAGACTTALKAFFDPDAILAAPVEVDPDTDATSLRPFSGTDSLTVGGELDKLAANISLGRDFAGVHWRTDGSEGLLLGEKVALQVLKDHMGTYTELGASVSFRSFDGSLVEL